MTRALTTTVRVALFVGAAVLAGIATTVGMRMTAHEAVSETVTVTQSTRTSVLTEPDQDTAFLMEIDKTGTIYDEAGVAIHNAKLVCEWLGRGMSEGELIGKFATAVEGSNEVRAATFVGIAVKHYCPKGPQV